MKKQTDPRIKELAKVLLSAFIRILTKSTLKNYGELKWKKMAVSVLISFVYVAIHLLTCINTVCKMWDNIDIQNQGFYNPWKGLYFVNAVFALAERQLGSLCSEKDVVIAEIQAKCIDISDNKFDHRSLGFCLSALCVALYCDELHRIKAGNIKLLDCYLK